jgi:hypothetical protein
VRPIFYIDDISEKRASELSAFGTLRRPYNVNIVAFFFARHKLKLKHPELPCVVVYDDQPDNATGAGDADVDGVRYYPLELLELVEEKREVNGEKKMLHEDEEWGKGWIGGTTRCSMRKKRESSSSSRPSFLRHFTRKLFAEVQQTNKEKEEKKEEQEKCKGMKKKEEEKSPSGGWMNDYEWLLSSEEEEEEESEDEKEEDKRTEKEEEETEEGYPWFARLLRNSERREDGVYVVRMCNDCMKRHLGSDLIIRGEKK